MAYNTRENLKLEINPGPGEDMNLPLEGRTRMNIVHEGTSTTPISRQTEGTSGHRMV
jgi:hypothetical protein